LCREKITLAEAASKSEEATEALLRAVQERGVLQVGQANLDGHVITEEDLEGLRQQVNEAGMAVLQDTFEITD